MSDKPGNKSMLSRRLTQHQQAQFRPRTLSSDETIPRRPKPISTDETIPSRRLLSSDETLPRRPRPTPEFETPELDQFPAFGKKTAAEIIAATADIEQARQLIDASYKHEARLSLAKVLYKDSGDAEAWWLYTKVAENEDQLYHILTALVSLPTNPYTPHARAKLAAMPYRDVRGAPLPGYDPNWAAKLLKEQYTDATIRRPSVKRHQHLMFSLAAVFVVISLLAISLGVIIQINAQGTPTPVPFPTVKASDVMDYLRKVNVRVSNVQTLKVPDTTWSSHDAVRFDVQQGSDKGTFIVLSYEKASTAGLDGFSAAHDVTYQKWGSSQFSNVLVLVSPDTAPSINTEIMSHLTEYLLAPYRDYLPTATPY